ncbi:MAG: DUF805 domain-containing protein [Gammaproteobacteria bacterium]|nr:DUF805 domain-containing protein [Gammaproteobacteria bacterium]
MNIAIDSNGNLADTANFAAPPRGPVDAIRTCLVKFFDFRGRASRSEFWWFFPVVVAMSFMSSKYITKFIVATHLPIPLWAATYIFAHIVIWFPLWAAAVRRLHDTNRTGWWILPDVANSLEVIAATGYMYYFYEGEFPGTGGSPLDEWMALFEPARESDMWWGFGLAVTVYYLFINGGQILVLCFCLIKSKPQQNRFDQGTHSASSFSRQST